MILLLRILFTILLFYIIYNQIIKPLSNNTKLFPFFRKTQLKKEVELAKETVIDLKEKVVDLEEAQRLLIQKQKLEQQIDEILKGKKDE